MRNAGEQFRIGAQLHGDLSALPALRTCVYRIVQEALTNCARHARATRVEISVRHEGAMLELTVSDDGVGIDPGRTRGMGLLGIEERVRELHGAFTVRSRQPNGTEVHVALPVSPEMEEVELARAAG